jgi:integrase/recombinase XerD
MTPAALRLHVEAYLKLRRSLGFHTRPVAHNLRELVEYVETQGFSWPIHAQTILDWISAAAAHCGLPGQRMRLIHARCFLKYLKASVPDTEVPGPGLLPSPMRPKPRLYSVEEITRLQQATSELWEPGSLWQLTPYAIIGLLASTGLRASEVMALKVTDVQLDSNPPYLHICKTKFYKSRMVPVHPTTASQLRTYLEQRNLAKPRRPSTAFFITGMGRPLSYPTLRRMFVRLLQAAGIQPNEGRRGPLIHSFRHGFAVQRLVAWYHDNRDVRAMIPHLSVYLGHISKEETYWYLTATPELLTAAGDAFRCSCEPGGAS